MSSETASCILKHFGFAVFHINEIITCIKNKCFFTVNFSKVPEEIR